MPGALHMMMKGTFAGIAVVVLVTCSTRNVPARVSVILRENRLAEVEVGLPGVLAGHRDLPPKFVAVTLVSTRRRGRRSRGWWSTAPSPTREVRAADHQPRDRRPLRPRRDQRDRHELRRPDHGDREHAWQSDLDLRQPVLAQDHAHARRHVLVLQVTNTTTAIPANVPFIIMCSAPGITPLPTPIGRSAPDPFNPLTFVIEDSIGIFNFVTLSGTGAIAIRTSPSSTRFPPVRCSA